MVECVMLNCDNLLGQAFSEVDDGLTLLCLLGRPDIDLLGIPTTFGNGLIDQGTSIDRSPDLDRKQEGTELE